MIELLNKISHSIQTFAFVNGDFTAKYVVCIVWLYVMGFGAIFYYTALSEDKISENIFAIGPWTFGCLLMTVGFPAVAIAAVWLSPVALTAGTAYLAGKLHKNIRSAKHASKTRVDSIPIDELAEADQVIAEDWYERLQKSTMRK